MTYDDIPGITPDPLGGSAFETEAGRVAPASAASSAGAFRSGDPAAERAILQCLFSAPGLLLEIADIVTAEDFSHPGYRDVFSTILSLDSAGRPFDLITVEDELRRVTAGKRNPQILAELADLAGDGSAENVIEYATIVAQRGTLRRLSEAGRRISAAATTAGADAEAVIGEAEQLLFGAVRNTSTTLVGMDVAVKETLAELFSDDPRVGGTSTGFGRLDAITAGFKPGQLITIAARPGVGKSALALQLAEQLAVNSGKVVPFLSYEMTKSELTLRLLSRHSGVHMQHLQQGRLRPELENQVLQAANALRELPLMFDDTPPPTIDAVRSTLRKLALRHELGAIVIDYLQLMSGSRGKKDQSRNDEVGEISRGLKQLAQELKVPIVALSQLNRGLEARNDKRPILSDLRDSGAIEQDSNMVLFVYRDRLYNPNADPHLTELIVAKNRSGATGTVLLHFDGARGANFTEADPNALEAPPMGQAPPQRQGAGPWGGGGGGRGFGGTTHF